jgi:hypothetical protein
LGGEQVQTTIGRKELTALPTISRSAEDFTRLEPSASGGSFGEETISITATL